MEILDVGCGSKPKGDVNVDLLIEDDEWKRRIEPKKIKNFIRADAHHLPFRNKVFKTTIMNHSLEHFDDDLKVIEEVCRVTKKDVKITVPNFLQHIADTIRSNKLTWIREHHKRRYTKKLLELLLADRGLTQIRNKLLEYEAEVKLNE